MASNQTVEQLLIRIDATTEVLRRELKKADTSMNRFEQGVGKSLKAVERQFTVFKRQIAGQLAGIFSVFAVQAFTKQIIQATDTMKELRAQIGLVTTSQANLNSVYDSLFSIANRTGQALDSTVTLYARMARNTEELGVSQEELLRVTETVNKAFVVSGTNAREASNAMIQLSQAFGKGKLDGEEFNAIAEQAPIILNAFAKQTNSTKGELKELAEQGKLTVGDVLLPAFKDLASTVDEQFSQIPVTVGRAMQSIRNIMTDAFGGIESAGFAESLVELQKVLQSSEFQNAAKTMAKGVIDAMGGIASAIGVLVNNLDALMVLIKGVTAVWALNFIPSIKNATREARKSTAQVFALGDAYAAMTKTSRNAARAQAVLASSTLLAVNAMNLLGGPAGVAIIAVSILDQIGTDSERAARKIDRLTTEIDELRDSTEGLSAAQRQQLAVLEKQKFDVLIEQVTRLKQQMEGLASKQIDEAFKSEEANRLQAALDGLNKKLMAQAKVIDTLFPKLETVVGIYEELAGVQKAAAFAVKVYSDQTSDLVEAIYAERDALSDSERQKRIDIELAKVKEKITPKIIAEITKAVDAYFDEKEAIKAKADAEKKANEIAKKTRKAYEDRHRAIKAYLEQLRRERDQVFMTSQEVELANAIRDLEIEGNEELIQIIKELIQARDENIQRLEVQSREQENALQKTTHAVRREASAWAKAFEQTASRIDEAFANAWQGAFDSFEDFADGLKNAFRQLIGEMAHIAITRPIVMAFTGGIGGFGAAGTAAASPIGNAAFTAGASAVGASGLSGALSGGFTSLGSGYVATGNLLRDIGLTAYGDAFAAQGVKFANSTLGSNLLSGAGLAGAGILGGLAGNKVFGDTTGLGALAGGFLGSPFGPLGAGVGSFLGTGAETLLGNVFGFGGKGGNQAGRANLNLATGQLDAFGVGKKFDEKNVEAATQLAQTLQTFSNVIGGSTATLGIKVGNTSGLAFNGQKFGGDQEAFLAAAFKAIVEGSTNLSKTLKTLVQNFKGTAAETMIFTEAVALLDLQIKTNPVGKAIEDFAAEQEIASRSLTDSYEMQLQQVKEMIFFFDGSAEAAANLNAAMAVTRETAYQLSLSMEAVSESTRMAVKDERRFFLDAVRTPDEKLQQMEKELVLFFEALKKMEDPAQIASTRDFLLQLNRDIFEAGPEDLQRANVDTFIDFAEKVGQITQSKLAESQVNLEATQENLNDKIGLMLDNAAAAFQNPADTMMDAAQLMFSAGQAFAGRFGNNQPAEVVA